MLRILLGVNAGALLFALAQGPDIASWPERFVDLAALVEPLLLTALVLLAFLQIPLSRLPLRTAQAAVLVLVVGLAVAQTALWLAVGLISEATTDALLRTALLAGAVSAAILTYFELRAGALAPSISDARLAALNARIRPHFLFNSLNAVLSLIRAEPRRAEEALESLADLFRAALRDPGERVALSEEIALTRQYLDLERLRLGERLQVTWEVAAVPMDSLIPPLMLQPLLENAIHHGIEPRAEGGMIHVRFSRHGGQLSIEITNPAKNGEVGPGNRMALANIRERLALAYDLEARLEIEAGAEAYRVRILLPCQTRPFSIF